MTVQTTTSAAQFAGNGATTSFPIGFKFNQEEDLKVKLINDSTGAETTLVLNSDYTVTGEGSETGGTVNTTVAVATGVTLDVRRIVDITQEVDLRNQGKFFAETHEQVFDYLTMIDQQQQTQLDETSADATEALETANEAKEIAEEALNIAELAGVASFNGRVGIVSPQSGDYNANQITYGGSSNVGAELAAVIASNALKAPNAFQRSETGGTASTVDMKLKRIVHIEDFGGAGDNSTDNSGPLANAIAAASANGQSGEVWFTNGSQYRFNSAVAMNAKVTLRGSSKNGTRLIRNFTAANDTIGLLNYTSYTASVCHMGMQTASGVTGGCLISMIAGATNSSPDFSLFDNLYLTYGAVNTYANCVYINGSARTDNIGVRDVTFRDCDMFGGTTGTVYADTTVNLRLHGSFFKGGSTSGKVTITASSTNDSYYTTIDANDLGGLSLNKCIYGDVRATVCVNQVTNTSTARYFNLRGVFNAGWQNNWNNCKVDDPTGARTARAVKSSRTDPDGTIHNYDTVSLTTSWQTFTFSKAYSSSAAVLSLNGNAVAGTIASVSFQNITATQFEATASTACTAKIKAEGY